VSERGLPIADGAHACPFVAFEDDRDERASVPDHRHRCYAEVRPAPRALAHQEAYCLSPAFPVCPTFQDWARRESARARDAAAAELSGQASRSSVGAPPPGEAARPFDPMHSGEPAGGGVAAAGAATGAGAAAMAGAAAAAAEDERRAERPTEPRIGEAPLPGEYEPDEPRRNPPRDWSAPPPWLASAEGGGGPPTDPPDFLARRGEPGRGLAGSAADQLAGGPPPRPSPPPQQPPPLAPVRPPPRVAEDTREDDLRDPGRPPAPPRRPRAYDQHLGGPSSGPDWERPRRYEAYPTIRTRIGMPAIPRLAGMAAAIAVAALALFFLPAILGLGSGEPPTTSPTPSTAPSSSLAPASIPAPTPTVYIIKKGDTLSKVAVAHGLSIEQLLDANPTIKNPDLIKEGQEIIIPVPVTQPPDQFGGSPSPSAAVP
jgi:hypothetical protein